jgi:F-type H+-transporting ATPase subunit gamma
MASIRQYRKKIKSAKNIAKITRAMQMVAASKMKRAQDAAGAGRDYAKELQYLAGLLSSYLDPNRHPLLKSTNVSEGRELILFLAPEKGLCGGLLTNLSKKLALTYPKLGGGNIDFIAVGKKAKNIITRLGGNIIYEFEIGLSRPSYELVPAISKLIEEKFLSGEVDKVTVFYMEFVNTMQQLPLQKVLLPLKLTLSDEPITKTVDFLFEPTEEILVKSLLERYLEVEIYQFLLEAYASEQSARMVAMKNATDNAQNLIGDLTIKYNNARQAGITAEITDISSANMITQ